MWVLSPSNYNTHLTYHMLSVVSYLSVHLSCSWGKMESSCPTSQEEDSRKEAISGQTVHCLVLQLQLHSCWPAGKVRHILIIDSKSSVPYQWVGSVGIT